MAIVMVVHRFFFTATWSACLHVFIVSLWLDMQLQQIYLGARQMMKLQTFGYMQYTWRAFCLVLATAAFGFVAPLASAADEPVSVTLALKMITLDPESGQELLTDSDVVSPGDRVEYQVAYTNNLDYAISGVMATLPLPGGMEFVAGTDLPQGATASVDGENFAAIPLTRTQTAADGSVRTVQVPFAEYRALRWQIAQIDAGATVTVRARAQVSAQ